MMLRLRIRMGQSNLERHRRYITSSYLLMFLALFTVITAVLAYWLARKVAMVDDAEVWIHAQALWVMRNAVIFLILALFASLWFIPLIFFYWVVFTQCLAQRFHQKFTEKSCFLKIILFTACKFFSCPQLTLHINMIKFLWSIANHG